MNIEKELTFSDEKPAILSIRKSDKINLVGVGLKKDQLLKKHKTSIPTLLTVLVGRIEFEIENKILVFETLDTFEIPVEVVHSAKGMEMKNIFTLTQEK